MHAGKQRLVELDALRGLAALAVVLFHYTKGREHLLFFFPKGWFGVHLFFMISGFVILMTLDRKRTVADFAFARFSRLYPTYWAAVLTSFCFVTLSAVPMREVSFEAAMVNMTMLQSFLGFPHIDNVYWTLHVELCFYLLMGLIVGVGLRRHLGSILAVLVAAHFLTALFDPLAEFSGIETYPPWDWLYLFLAGIAFYQMRLGWRWRHAGLLALCFADAAVQNPWHDLIIIAAIGAVMFAATQYRIPLLRNRGFLFLGTISYPLYLVHENIGYILIRTGDRLGINVYVSILAATGVSLALAWILIVKVDRPASALLRAKHEAWKTSRPCRAS